MFYIVATADRWFVQLVDHTFFTGLRQTRTAEPRLHAAAH